MDKQKLTAIVGGSVVGVIALVVLWTLISAMSRVSEAKEQLADAENQLQTIYRSKMFPSATNQAIVVSDDLRIQEWLGAVSNRLHKGDIEVQTWLTPSSLKQEMIKIVKDPLIAPMLGDKPSIGFDDYMGASSAMAKESDVPGLGRQLEYVRRLLTLCAEAGVTQVEKVERPKFESTKAEAKEEAPTTRRRGRRRNTEPEPKKASNGIDKVGDGIAERQRFRLTLHASTPALLDFLNRLTDAPMITVVSDFHLTRPSCILKDFTQTNDPNRQATPSGDTIDFTTLAPEDRVVSDPAQVQPLKVELTIDIYTFEGV